MSTTHLNYCVSLVKCRGTIFSEGANATMSDPLVGTDVQVLLERLFSLTIEELKFLRKFNKVLKY